MKERSVEHYLCERVKQLEGFCIKLNPTGYVGIPDRLVILPGVVCFVELKKPKNSRTSGKQKLWHSRLRQLGCNVDVLYTKGEIDDFIKRYSAAGTAVGN